MVGSPTPHGNDDHPLRAHAYTMTYCPSCGCAAEFHGSMIRLGQELVPRCESCRGPCWRSVGTPFAQAVADRLRDIEK